MTAEAAKAPLLRVEGLCVDYRGPRRAGFRAVDSIDLVVHAGETLGLVGESGSGKSTIANAILGIAPVAAGSVIFDGVELDPRRFRRRRPVTDIQVIFQDPTGSLDPSKTVAYTVAEPLVAKARRERESVDRTAIRRRVGEMLERVGMSPEAAYRYPAQFSGGQRQRIAIARALIVGPKLVICDEAVSALDLSVQAQILNLLRDVQRETGVGYLFISHDLSVVEHVADRVMVLYRGREMESGPTDAVHHHPRHPYTRSLLAASPVQDPVEQSARRALRAAYRTGSMAQGRLGDRCPYEHRCPFAVDRCAREQPPLEVSAAGGRVACHRHEELPDFDTPPEDRSAFAGGSQ